MQDNLWHLNYSTSIFPFESGKCGKDGKKIQKFEYLENEKSFFDEIKYIFHSFWSAIIWWKIKNLIKNSRHKLYSREDLPGNFPENGILPKIFDTV